MTFLSAAILCFAAGFLQSCNLSQRQRQSEIVYHNLFPSQFVEARNIEVWLPPDYDPEKSYDVIYIHDGQNVFNDDTSYGGVSWEMDSVMTSLIQQGLIRPAIVVGIWNSQKRFQEYMPNEPYEEIRNIRDTIENQEEILSDQYLSFIVNELKPFIDKEYSTEPAVSSTYIMGSSMGGLISLYAIMEYPLVFGGAACLSTHWPAVEGVFIDYLPGNLPDPATHKIYFDHGTINLDSLYQPFQSRVDSIMEASGYTIGINWTTLVANGEDHNEDSWRKRLHQPLTFLLGEGQD